jgi:hypothetical protein
MNGKRHLGRIFFTLILLFSTLVFTNAANRYSVATGNWSATGTWSASSGGAAGASVPVAGDNVFIERGFTVTTIANAACATLTVDDATTASSLNLGAFTIAVSGTTTIGGGASGSNITITSATGTKTFTGAVP